MKKEPQSHLVSIRNAAEALRIPAASVYVLIQRGHLRGVHTGQRMQVRQDSLKRLVVTKPQPPLIS